MKKKILAFGAALVLCMALVFVVLGKNGGIISGKSRKNQPEATNSKNKTGDEAILSGEEWKAFASKDVLYQGAEIVTLGSYEQDGDGSNGKESIEWIVLDETEDSQLVISKYVLETRMWGKIPSYTNYFPNGETDVTKTYKPGIGVRLAEHKASDGSVFYKSEEYEIENEIEYTWENSDLRNYLNSIFINKAFTEEEKERIETAEIEYFGASKASDNETQEERRTSDRLFVFSVDEAEKYFSKGGALSYYTPYCLEKTQTHAEEDLKSLKENGGRLPSGFVLRTKGKDIYNICVLKAKQELEWENQYIDGSLPVRPAMWIKKQ